MAASGGRTNWSRIILFILLFFIAIIVGIIAYYGTADPCRMLAQERAWDTVERGSDWEETVESVQRLVTSQMETGECVSELTTEWQDNLSEFFNGE